MTEDQYRSIAHAIDAVKRAAEASGNKAKVRECDDAADALYEAYMDAAPLGYHLLQ